MYRCAFCTFDFAHSLHYHCILAYWLDHHIIMVMMMTSKNHGGGDLFCQLEGGRSRGKEDRRQTNGGEPPPKGPTTSNSCSDKCSLRDRFKRCLLESKSKHMQDQFPFLLEWHIISFGSMIGWDVISDWDISQQQHYKCTSSCPTSSNNLNTSEYTILNNFFHYECMYLFDLLKHFTGIDSLLVNMTQI